MSKPSRDTSGSGLSIILLLLIIGASLSGVIGTVSQMVTLP